MYVYGKKEAINLKETQKGNRKLERGKGKKKCCDCIIVSKVRKIQPSKKKKKSKFQAFS